MKRKQFRIAYDPDVDILVIDLGDLTTSVGATEISQGVYLDLDEQGTVLSLEVLDASKRYDMALLAQHPPNYEEPMSLADAARLFSSTPQALQKAILRGKLRGKKVGKTWSTSLAAVNEYMNSRSVRGRRAKASLPQEAASTAPAEKPKT